MSGQLQPDAPLACWEVSVKCFGQQENHGTGALCSAPHSPHSFPTQAARSSPSRVAAGGFAVGFHLTKSEGQWRGLCTGVWELVSLLACCFDHIRFPAGLSSGSLYLFIWGKLHGSGTSCSAGLIPYCHVKPHLRHPCFLPAVCARVCNVRTLTGVFTQNLVQKKTLP